MNDSNASPQAVLIHGLGANRMTMWAIARRLKQCGFATHNWGYFSLRGTIEKHADRFSRFINHVASQNEQPIHVVAHSMGAIVARRALLNQPDLRSGRVVLLAPPNQGSFVASKLSFLRWVCPAVGELSNHDTSYVRQLDEPSGYQIAIIQAEYDVLIRISDTLLEADYPTVALPVIHSGVLFNRRSLDCIESFLKKGVIPTEENA